MYERRRVWCLGQIIAQGRDLVTLSDSDWIRGSREAKVSIVEFSDFECPFCGRLHPTLQRLIESYPSDVNWVYKHFPLDSIHPTANIRAQASECAGELGGNEFFWNYADSLFEKQRTISTRNIGEQLAEIAEEIGLDKSQFSDCLDSQKHQGKVAQDFNQAIAAGGQGTPFSLIIFDGQQHPISGAVPYRQFQSLLDSIL